MLQWYQVTNQITTKALNLQVKPYVALAYWDRTIFGAPPTSIMNQFDINSSLLAIKIHHYALVTFSGGADISMMPRPSLLGVAN